MLIWILYWRIRSISGAEKTLESQSSAAEKSIAAKIEAFQKERLAKFQRDVYETQQRAQNIPLLS